MNIMYSTIEGNSRYIYNQETPLSLNSECIGIHYMHTGGDEFGLYIRDNDYEKIPKGWDWEFNHDKTEAVFKHLSHLCRAWEQLNELREIPVSEHDKLQGVIDYYDKELKTKEQEIKHLERQMMHLSYDRSEAKRLRDEAKREQKDLEGGKKGFDLLTDLEKEVKDARNREEGMQ